MKFYEDRVNIPILKMAKYLRNYILFVIDSSQSIEPSSKSSTKLFWLNEWMNPLMNPAAGVEERLDEECDMEKDEVDSVLLDALRRPHFSRISWAFKFSNSLDAEADW